MYDNMLGLDAPAKEEVSNEAFPNLYKNHGLLSGRAKPEDMGGDRPTSGKHYSKIGPGKLSEM